MFAGFIQNTETALILTYVDKSAQNVGGGGVNVQVARLAREGIRPLLRTVRPPFRRHRSGPGRNHQRR